MKHYIVICQQVIGGDRTPMSIAYNFDHEYFATRALAKKHGFKIRGSDDFNIAIVEGGKVTGFYWMDEDMSTLHDIREINEQLSFDIHDGNS